MRKSSLRKVSRTDLKDMSKIILYTFTLDNLYWTYTGIRISFSFGKGKKKQWSKSRGWIDRQSFTRKGRDVLCRNTVFTTFMTLRFSYVFEWSSQINDELCTKRMKTKHLEYLNFIWWSAPTLQRQDIDIYYVESFTFTKNIRLQSSSLKTSRKPSFTKIYKIKQKIEVLNSKYLFINIQFGVYRLNVFFMWFMTHKPLLVTLVPRLHEC